MQVQPVFAPEAQTSLEEVGVEALLVRQPSAAKHSSAFMPKPNFPIPYIQNFQDFPVPCCKRRYISDGQPATNSLFQDIHRLWFRKLAKLQSDFVCVTICLACLLASSPKEISAWPSSWTKDPAYGASHEWAGSAFHRCAWHFKRPVAGIFR